MNTTNSQNVQSKVAQYIAGEVKLNDLIDSNRLSVPVQKRFKFEDTWITMNRTIGEAILQRKPSEFISVGHAGPAAAALATAAVSGRTSWDKSKKATEIQQKRRNAIAVINQATREMTNGHSWPKMEDWLICPDQKIRYAQFIVPFRKPNESEWLQKSVGSEIRTANDKASKMEVFTAEVPQAPPIAPAPASAPASASNSVSASTPAVTVPELKLDNNPANSAKSEKQAENVANPAKLSVSNVTPNKAAEEKSNPKFGSTMSTMISSCPSNYNTPGCFGPLPEPDI